MMQYINNILGFTYDQNPVLYVIGVMFVMWMIYLVFGFLRSCFGLNK